MQNKSTRDGFGQGMLNAANKNSKVVALCADLTESMKLGDFAKKFPDRFIQVGVAEQNMIGVAAGLTIFGKIPVAASFAVFSPGRSWDQIRVSVCYSNLNVKIAGGHTGLSVGKDGASHQSLEDIATMRVLPNMTVVVPCDYDQAIQATQAILNHSGPCYLRLTRDNTSLISDSQQKFQLGRAQILRPGKDITIIGCGPILSLALQAADQLVKQNISARVINLHTIKPIDKQTLIEAAKQTQGIITLEDHQISGGMGSAVAEVLSQHQPTKIKMIGVEDSFGESGKSEELWEKYGLTTSRIITEAKKLITDSNTNQFTKKHETYSRIF